jgi:hypothetical protein
LTRGRKRFIANQEFDPFTDGTEKVVKREGDGTGKAGKADNKSPQAKERVERNYGLKQTVFCLKRISPG